MGMSQLTKLYPGDLVVVDPGLKDMWYPEAVDGHLGESDLHANSDMVRHAGKTVMIKSAVYFCHTEDDASPLEVLHYPRRYYVSYPDGSNLEYAYDCVWCPSMFRDYAEAEDEIPERNSSELFDFLKGEM